jgi:hypothetical protein
MPLHTYEFGIIDGAGQSFIIKGSQTDEDRDARFILPREVVERANVVYNITTDVVIKCRWATTLSGDTQRILRGMFQLMRMSTTDLRAKYDGTVYGSRTHRQVY